MLIDLRRDLKPGEHYQANLQFEKAREVSAEVAVVEGCQSGARILDLIYNCFRFHHRIWILIAGFRLPHDKG
jgi:hypothetical protein